MGGGARIASIPNVVSSIAATSSRARVSVGGALWRMVGLLVLGLLVLVPSRSSATNSLVVAVPSASPSEGLDDDEGGACGDEEEQDEELVHCGAELSLFERPGLLGVLRESLERMQPGQCLELLDALYERESCQVGGRECGNLLPVGLPPLPAKSLTRGASGGQAWLDRLAVDDADGDLALARASDDRAPRGRAIAPPDRPPR